jgi:hypothetical protein
MKERREGELVFDEGFGENQLIREDSSSSGLLGRR